MFGFESHSQLESTGLDVVSVSHLNRAGRLGYWPIVQHDERKPSVSDQDGLGCGLLKF